MHLAAQLIVGVRVARAHQLGDRVRVKRPETLTRRTPRGPQRIQPGLVGTRFAAAEGHQHWPAEPDAGTLPRDRPDTNWTPGQGDCPPTGLRLAYRLDTSARGCPLRRAAQPHRRLTAALRAAGLAALPAAPELPADRGWPRERQRPRHSRRLGPGASQRNVPSRACFGLRAADEEDPSSPPLNGSSASRRHQVAAESNTGEPAQTRSRRSLMLLTGLVIALVAADLSLNVPRPR